MGLSFKNFQNFQVVHRANMNFVKWVDVLRKMYKICTFLSKLPLKWVVVLRFEQDIPAKPIASVNPPPPITH